MQETQLIFWGNNQNNLLSSENIKAFITPQRLLAFFDIVDISASEKHVSFITSDGALYSYGLNLDGRLGIGGKADIRRFLQSPSKIKLSGRAIKIRCGFSHACVELENRQLYAWGLGDYGSLGIGEFRSKSTPTKVVLEAEVSEFSCGAMHTGYIDTQGNVYTTGSNEYGELGVNKPEKIATPTLINFNQKVKKIECGVFYTLLLSQRGQVFGMGNNKYGQLGIGHKVDQCYPTLIRELQGIISIAAGYHSGAIDQMGNLYIWGSGNFGQFLKPKKFILSYPVHQIYIRGFFGLATCNSKQNSHVFVWGNNTYGELARGNHEALKDPGEIFELSKVQLGPIACGVNFIIAVSKHAPHHFRNKSKQIQKQLHAHHNKVPEIKELNRKYINQQNIDVLDQAFIPSNSHHYRSVSPYTQNRSRFRRETQEIQSPREQPYNKEIGTIHTPAEKRSRSRSRSRGHNYEELFVKLSKDYEHLLSKYNILEEQLQKDRLKKELSQGQKERQEVRQYDENKILREQLSIATHGLKISREESSVASHQLEIAREELRLTLRKLSSLEDESLYKEQELTALREKPSQLTNQLSEQFNQILNQKEKYINQLSNNHAKIEKELYQSIKLLESQNQMVKEFQENQRARTQVIFQHEKDEFLKQKQTLIQEFQKERINLVEEMEKLNIIHEKTTHDLKLFEGQLRNSEENRIKEEKAFHQKIDANIANLFKFKEVQELNDLRAIELKNKIEIQQKLKQDLSKELECCNLEIVHLQEHKKEMFKMIEQARENAEAEIKIYKQKLDELVDEKSVLQQKGRQVQVELNYEREYNKRCEETIKQTIDLKDKTYKEVDRQRQLIDNQKEKNKELSLQVEKAKTHKKEIQMLHLQIERQQHDQKHYQKEIDQILSQKQDLLNQLRHQAEKKQIQIDKLQEKMENQINKLTKEAKKGEKELQQKNRDFTDLKKQYERKLTEIDNLKDNLEKTQRKLAFKTQQMEIEIHEHEKTSEEFVNLRREYAKLKSEKEELQRKYEELQNEKEIAEEKIKENKKQIERLISEIKKVEERSENLRKQTEFARKELEESNWALEESNKVNEEVEKANKEFAQNQQKFNSKINELECRVFELEDENKSYTPRYEAMQHRNRELDERNRQLSDMVNKAIEIQAQAYKTNILREVEINSEHIIEKIKEEQDYKQRNRRKEVKQDEEENYQEYLDSSKSPGIVSKIKDEPYTRLMNQKISMHKKKVTDSAQKLAGILDLTDKGDQADRPEHKASKEFSRSSNLKRNQEYEKINEQMQSLSNQKEEFMKKISSFAEKLKIL